MTVDRAFDETYYLERACRNLLITMASVGGQKQHLKIMKPGQVQEFSQSPSLSKENLDLYAKRHFYAYWNLYLKEHPDVFL